jgi:hypothetical protein
VTASKEPSVNKLAIVALALVLMPACAHVPASSSQLATRHGVNAWTGDVRIAVGNAQTELDGKSTALVEATVRGLLAQHGIAARVECLTKEGDIDLIGALHARVRVDFPERIRLDQKYEVLNLLDGMRPNAAAYVDRSKPRRAAGGAGGVSASLTTP